MDRIALQPATVREVSEALHAFLCQVLGRPSVRRTFLVGSNTQVLRPSGFAGRAFPLTLSAGIC